MKFSIQVYLVKTQSFLFGGYSNFVLILIFKKDDFLCGLYKYIIVFILLVNLFVLFIYSLSYYFREIHSETSVSGSLLCVWFSFLCFLEFFL